MDRPTILFIDPVCPKPYSPVDLVGCGGTEATVCDVALGLEETGEFNVVVEQHNRTEDYAHGNVRFRVPGKTPDARWVVILRNPHSSSDARKRFPNAKIYVWSHDLANRDLGLAYSQQAFRDVQANICVSKWHRSQTIEVLKPFGYHGEFRTKYIYNPLNADVVRTGEPYDRNKLLWLASPHKGLARALEIFHYLVKLNKDFKFYVANPGYYPDQEALPDNVIALGSLPHAQVIQHARTALALFYPNTVFPETFGKILAEANAVGTPVLTHPFGAAQEVLDTHPGQLVSCYDTEAVIKRIMKWYEGARPIVRSKPAFKLFNVINEWKRLLYELR
jgi:glycosyltransferase involved in cell wall biosynthesis